MQNRAIIWLLLDHDEDDLLELIPFLEHKKRQKVHDLFARRRQEGAFSILIERYLFSDHEKFTSFLRVSPRKNPIDPSQKLCIALRYYNVCYYNFHFHSLFFFCFFVDFMHRYLATGETFQSLSFNFRICASWICKIV